MRIEEYIKLRKKQELVNEMDISKKTENIEKMIGYIFDFYKLYESENKENKNTIQANNKIIKYQRDIEQYSDEIQTWLLRIFNKHGVKVEKHLSWVLDTTDVFLLVNNEKSMEKLSYSVYNRCIRKRSHSFLDEYPIEIIAFMKDYHKIVSKKRKSNLKLTKEIKHVVKNMHDDFGINIIEWAGKYLSIFLDDIGLWPVSHCIFDKETNEMIYNVNANTNLFALNRVIESIPLEDNVKLYMKKNKKQIVEILKKVFIQKEKERG